MVVAMMRMDHHTCGGWMGTHWLPYRSCLKSGRRRRESITMASYQNNKMHYLADVEGGEEPTRRALLLFGVASLATIQGGGSARAFEPPPPGYRRHEDKLDGYSFLYPSDWIPVTTSGNDVFYRNPLNAEENVFVDISSPSSSKYSSIEDIGTPEQAAEKTLEQYLEEFMSTRLGVKRTAEIEKASSRVGVDGKSYYDIETRVTSYASRNQLAVTQGEIDEAIELEFDRRYLTVLGTANNRLYAMRLQTNSDTFKRDPERLYKVAQSFVCKQV